MGTELTGDLWLTLLITPGAKSSAPARTLLRAQILTYNRTKHLIALGEEFPRKAIMKEAAYGRVPKIYVRCWRCGTVAWISDWIGGSELVHESRLERIAQAEATGKGERIGFLRQCDGAAYLEQLAAAFDVNLQEAETCS